MNKRISIVMPSRDKSGDQPSRSIPDVNAVEDFVNAGAERSGKPLLMALSLIDEDGAQVRQHFDEAKLEELAETIRARGVKTPISVRPHPADEGRYIINHGARRYRASLLAGLDSIPTYVDEAYTDDDQAIENLQRDDLTAREVAEFLNRRINKDGIKRSHLAATIGKSPSYITKHLALLSLPGPIADAFNKGTIVDVNLLYQLSVLYKDAPVEVSDWIAYANADLTRDSLKRLQAEIEAKRSSSEDAAEEASAPVASEGQDDENASETLPSSTLRRPQIVVRDGNREAELLYKKRARDPAYAWIKYADGSESEIALSSLMLVTLHEK